ncbi:SGF29 tudor-like domain-containing protein [Gloeopeniophorella convolvens]|nr:SGF29 tudor-like domain-containing protein [Gloeopeniophorella convolvens]
MERRRGVSKRPASTEEIEVWSRASGSISALSSPAPNSTTQDPIGRVNKLIATWPVNDALPADGLESIRSIKERLVAGLNEVKVQCDRDMKAIDDALERLGVLVALRKAPESIPQEKRLKRPRAHSPTTSAPSTPALGANGRSTSIPVQRGSVGPPSIPALRETKARRDTLRDTLLKQLPLREGRMVAFHPPMPAKGADGTTPEDTTWIMARIIRAFAQDKHRYEVEDIEPQEDGKPLRYIASLKSTPITMIPLPDKDAPLGNPAHLGAYQEFPAGATVMALYPDTSCFYRAEVVASPRDIPTQGRNSGATYYKLKFEDDDDQEHEVSATEVVEWPGP